MRDHKHELESLVNKGLLVIDGKMAHTFVGVWYRSVQPSAGVFFRVISYNAMYHHSQVSLVHSFALIENLPVKFSTITSFQKYFKDISQPTPDECILFEIEYPEAYKQLNKYLRGIYKY